MKYLSTHEEYTGNSSIPIADIIWLNKCKQWLTAFVGHLSSRLVIIGKHLVFFLLKVILSVKITVCFAVLLHKERPLDLS